MTIFFRIFHPVLLYITRFLLFDKLAASVTDIQNIVRRTISCLHALAVMWLAFL